MARSSSISSRLFANASKEELAALKAKLDLQATELATLKTSGVGINQDTLSLSLKPLQAQIMVADQSAKEALTGVDSVDDKVDLLAGVVDTNSTNTTANFATVNKAVNDAAFNAQEALTQAAAASVSLSKIPGLIQDANYNTNSKTSEIRGSVNDLSVKHDALAATVENMRQTMITVDGKIASIEGVHGQVIADLQTSLTALVNRVTVIEGII